MAYSWRKRIYSYHGGHEITRRVALSAASLNILFVLQGKLTFIYTRVCIVANTFEKKNKNIKTKNAYDTYYLK